MNLSLKKQLAGKTKESKHERDLLQLAILILVTSSFGVSMEQVLGMIFSYLDWNCTMLNIRSKDRYLFAPFCVDNHFQPKILLISTHQVCISEWGSA